MIALVFVALNSSTTDEIGRSLAVLYRLTELKFGGTSSIFHMNLLHSLLIAFIRIIENLWSKNGHRRLGITPFIVRFPDDAWEEMTLSVDHWRFLYESL